MSLAPSTWQPKRYLHIAFNLPPLWGPTQIAIQNVIAAHALDWLRYSGNCWIVWTSETPQQWGDKFNALVPEIQSTSFLIFTFDLNSSLADGWANFPQWIWDWIRRYRA